MLTSKPVIQTIGGAFFVSAGESAFEASLTKKLRAIDPSVSPLAVIGTGATAIRSTFSAEDLPFILRAYSYGIQIAFIVAIALAAASAIISLGARYQKMVSPTNPSVNDGTASSAQSLEANKEEV
jgi:hypothetical protein